MSPSRWYSWASLWKGSLRHWTSMRGWTCWASAWRGSTAVTGDTQHVCIESDGAIVTPRQKGREMAAEVGFSGSDLTIIATAISEIARNILSYAREGEI